MGTGRQGITIGIGTNLHIENNVIQYSSRSAIDIEPVSSRGRVQNIYIDHNTFGPHGNNLFAEPLLRHRKPHHRRCLLPTTTR